MDQSNNIAAAYNALWNTAGLSTGSPPLIPGGLQMSKEHMKAPSSRPYAQVFVTLDGTPQWTAGLSYAQNYRIDVKVWCGSDNTVLVEVDAALDALLPFSAKLESTSFLTQGSRTLHITTHPEGIDQEDYRDNQQNIGLVHRAWRVLLQQTRSEP